VGHVDNFYKSASIYLYLTAASVLRQLLNSERLSIFAADLQVSFLLFEALRTHLKFQLEFYLTRVIDIIVSDSPRINYEQKEIALGNGFYYAVY
jgi:hypothetical protein